MEKSQITQLKNAISTVDSIIIGAGAGLSTSAGFTYSGERFNEYFSDFALRYGFKDMYSGGFYPYKTLEENWAYWSRHIMINRYMDAPKPVYKNLLSLVQGKDYFVITTNVDHCFQKAGFNKKRLYYTQGDYGLFQCSEPCHQKTYDNEETVKKMVASQNPEWLHFDKLSNQLSKPLATDNDKTVISTGSMTAGSSKTDLTVPPETKMTVPTELVPLCPICGKPMSMNLRADDTFVQDDGWYKAAERYENFLTTRKAAENGKVLFLELGVGGNTPGIIKYPFWQMTYKNPNATYACMNFGEAVVPAEIKQRSICINADIGDALKEIL